MMLFNTIGPLLASDASTSTPLQPHLSPSPARSGETGPTVPADPFATIEGTQHHRCPAKLNQRIAELERECSRLQNVTSDQADEIARLRVALDAKGAS